MLAGEEELTAGFGGGDGSAGHQLGDLADRVSSQLHRHQDLGTDVAQVDVEEAFLRDRLSPGKTRGPDHARPAIGAAAMSFGTFGMSLLPCSGNPR